MAQREAETFKPSRCGLKISRLAPNDPKQLTMHVNPLAGQTDHSPLGRG